MEIESTEHVDFSVKHTLLAFFYVFKRNDSLLWVMGQILQSYLLKTDCKLNNKKKVKI